jgi:hypothetical protein
MSRGRLHQKVCRLGENTVYVRDHTYLDDTYQRLSNWVTYSAVGADGVVVRETAGDYDMGQFSPLVKVVELRVTDWNGVGEPA